MGMWLLSMCEAVKLECKGLDGRNEACLRQRLTNACRLAWRLYVVYVCALDGEGEIEMSGGGRCMSWTCIVC